VRNRKSIQNTKLVAVNNLGLRIGKDHHRAKYSNRMVDLVLELRNGGLAHKRISQQKHPNTHRARYL